MVVRGLGSNPKVSRFLPKVHSLPVILWLVPIVSIGSAESQLGALICITIDSINAPTVARVAPEMDHL